MHAEDSIMRTTIKDIARECGVSTATVSLALSGRKTKISEKTCKMIRFCCPGYGRGQSGKCKDRYL